MSELISFTKLNGYHTINDNYTKGLLLLTLTVMGNFVAETLGCSTQKLLGTSRMAKLLVIFFLIYFTLNFTTDTTNIHPFDEIKMTFVLWILFIIFTKMPAVSTGIVFICLCLHYVLSNFYKYYNANNINQYDNLIFFIDNIVLFTIFITTVIGFITYIIKEKREHKRFSWYKFFIGVNKCSI